MLSDFLDFYIIPIILKLITVCHRTVLTLVLLNFAFKLVQSCFYPVCAHVKKGKVKGIFLYSGVSSPLDH